MGDIDPSKLKVTELRSELQARGLDTRGNKAVLVERLKEALEAETQGDENAGHTNGTVDTEVAQAEEEEMEEQGVTQQEEEEKPQEPEPQAEPIDGDEEVIDALVKEEPQDDLFKEDFEQAPAVKIEEEAEVKQEEAEVKQETEVKEECIETEEAERGTKRKSDAGSEGPPDSKRVRPDDRGPTRREDNEPEFDPEEVVLDWYVSDMSLLIDKTDRLSATPLTEHGFCYVWHGAKSTWGFNTGLLCFEVRVDLHLTVSHLEEEEQHPFVVRVGWSTEDSGLVLGEEPFSYGYGGTGKASTNLKFKDYGISFEQGDVVGCFLNLDVDPIVMSFTVNGKHQGIAYEIQHAELGDRSFFPHVLTKNCKFSVNFGKGEPWSDLLTGYTYVAEVPVEQRVRGPLPIQNREDCEVIMMVGLPGAGKTTWVGDYVSKHKEAKYNVLGTNDLIDRMKVNGLPRKRNYHGRWDVLIERCTKCLNKLLDMAYVRRRNFIVDQTNVYPSAQRRKMKGFGGYKRRAVVICPSDDELKRRTLKREKDEGKDIPDHAVLEMKANYKLPEVGEVFDEVEFIELEREEADQLVRTYNKEGENAGYGQKKSFRGGYNRRGGGPQNDRRDNRNFGSSNYRGFNRGNRGSLMGRGSSSMGGGGWNRDRMPSSRGGSFGRDSRGGYGRDRGGRGGGGSGGGFYRGSWSKPQGGMGYGSSNWQDNSSGGGSMGGYGQSWGNQDGYGSSGGSGAAMGGQSGGGYGSWNQQYYQQQQQQQPYWDQGQSRGGYNSYNQQGFGASGGSMWGSQSGWGSSGVGPGNQGAWNQGSSGYGGNYGGYGSGVGGGGYGGGGGGGGGYYRK